MSKPKGYVEAGHIDVDAGSIWVGDGCYVLKDPNEKRPKDLGDDWHGICDRFFERSGYDAMQKEWWEYDHKVMWAWTEVYAKFAKGEIPALPDRKQWEDEYRKNNPFVPTPGLDKGYANFTHDGGWGGMGMMISTNYGDGTYPVYIKYGKNGRPSRVLIDFE